MGSNRKSEPQQQTLQDTVEKRKKLPQDRNKAQLTTEKIIEFIMSAYVMLLGEFTNVA